MPVVRARVPSPGGDRFGSAAWDRLRVRPLARADEHLLSALFSRNSDRCTVRYFHPFPLTADTAGELVGHHGRDRYYVAECSRTLVGLSMLRGWDEGFEIPSFGILVDHDWRGQGVGSTLTEFTLGEAAVLGAAAVRLSVYASHVVAVRLYLDLGFVETSRDRVRTSAGDDDIVVMTKTF